MWSLPADDAPVESWRVYWLMVGAAGLVLFAGPETWRRFRQGARREGALFFLRVYTDRNEWRPKHVVVLGAFAASGFVLEAVPDDSRWKWVALIAFIAMLESLRILPVHRGRREPNAPGSGLQP